MAAKSKAKKTSASTSVKKAVVKKKAKPAVSAKAAKAPAKSAKATVSPPAKKAAPVKTKAVVAAKTTEEAPGKKKSKLRTAASDALEAALLAETDANPVGSEEEEFDPAAFFAGSGQTGDFRPHVMRKERVDLAISVRYRFTKGPLVFNAELINLSKGGLCLRTPEKIKNNSEIRIEIPLPHTSELFAVLAEVVWSDPVDDSSGKKSTHTGLRFKPMSLAKQTVINQFIQQRRDEVIMAKIGLDKFTDSVPVAGLD